MMSLNIKFKTGVLLGLLSLFLFIPGAKLLGQETEILFEEDLPTKED